MHTPINDGFISSQPCCALGGSSPKGPLRGEPHSVTTVEGPRKNLHGVEPAIDDLFVMNLAVS